ncbi:unnamed protein product [Rhizophagus irregularis]|uniref:Ubiquitin-like domain-containing protein n=1 Tax=Rhizophagus irregularis TaxID=588596 RepID=A0A915ZTL2_9GLOM|nr:unnamed protein product [Rhizophagus irregularis]GBC18700.1 nucleus protein [Rhizophagus irregularis DAOM 181602=DAOM 197198]CAB4441172.1 unnamed protein product [Rhizophagus irregularis]CAB4463415.1 unnamed protein product [Rhizophagus irregularis]CAB5389425.1 unnamed protein product [Rhizophagus irregularis]
MKSLEETQGTQKIIVTWGKEKIHLDFLRQGAGSLEETTLKQLKERLKKITGVPVNGQKLVFSGAIMKDDTATLSSLGIGPSSKVLLMGTKPDDKDLVQTTTGSPEEHALIERISQSIEKTRTNLIPQIESLETSASTFLSNQNDVVCPPEFETARKKRREAVQYTQGLIDRVDSVKDQLLHTSPTEVKN